MAWRDLYHLNSRWPIISSWRLHVGIIVSLWVLVYPYIAYAYPPRRWDEMEFYFPTAKRMVTHNDWLIPVLTRSHLPPSGRPFLEHPPLAKWIHGLFLTVFGTNIFALRLPSILLGLASALLIYHIAKSEYDWRTGLAGGIIFLATPYVSITGHAATSGDMDIYLLFFGSVFVWLVWRKCDQAKWMRLAGIFGAAAFLSKGLAAGAFLLTIGPLVLIRHDEYLTREAVEGVFSGLVVLIPWPLYAYLKHPEELVQQLIIYQVDRTQGSLGPGKAYLKMIFGLESWSTGDIFDMFANLGGSGYQVARFSVPVLVYLSILGLVLAYRRGHFETERDLFLTWWALSFPLFFSIFSGNKGWYIFPMMVPLAILSANMLNQVVDALNTREQLPYLSDRMLVIASILLYMAIYLVYFTVSNSLLEGPPTTNVTCAVPFDCYR